MFFLKKDYCDKKALVIGTNSNGCEFLTSTIYHAQQAENLFHDYGFSVKFTSDLSNNKECIEDFINSLNGDDLGCIYLSGYHDFIDESLYFYYQNNGSSVSDNYFKIDDIKSLLDKKGVNYILIVSTYEKEELNIQKDRLRSGEKYNPPEKSYHLNIFSQHEQKSYHENDLQQDSFISILEQIFAEHLERQTTSNFEEWMVRLLAWANESRLSEEDIPRDKDKLLALTKIEIDPAHSVRYLPSEIGKLSHLEMLRIANSAIKFLPEEIGELQNLTTLDLGWGNLNELTPEIGKLKKLEALILHDNQISNLPDEIGDLISLGSLNIERNQIDELPESIGYLSNLYELFIDENGLNFFPESIGNLTELTEITANYNNLDELPDSFVNLKNLRNFEAAGNDIDLTISQEEFFEELGFGEDYDPNEPN